MSSFSIRANREGMSVVCRMPSSVAQAAKAGMKTWWTALTTRSDGSASDSSISSKPWKANAKKWQRCNSRKCWHLGLLYFYSITTAMLFDRQTKTILRNTINTDSVLSTHTPGNICQGRQCTPWWFPDSWSQPPWPCQLCPQRASAAAWTTPRSYGFPSAEKKLAFCSLTVIYVQPLILCEHILLQEGTVPGLRRPPRPTVFFLDICGWSLEEESNI